jgi:hypothetical protein
MMNYLRKDLRRYIVMLFLLFIVPSCVPASTASTPAAIHDIPVPPGSVLYEGPYESTLDMMYITTRRAFDISNRNCEEETLYYLLESPRDGLDEQLGSYQTAFAATDWRPDETVDLLGVRRWTRPSTAGEQTLTLGVIPFTRGDSIDYILTMVLVTGTCHP